MEIYMKYSVQMNKKVCLKGTGVAMVAVVSFPVALYSLPLAFGYSLNKGFAKPPV
jgi:hypothetical protein